MERTPMSKENEIAAFLEEMIFGGKLGPGMKVPSSYELAERFGTAKETANNDMSAEIFDNFPKPSPFFKAFVEISNS